MKIKETFTSHTGLIDVGRFAFFINISKDGIFVPNEELVNQAMYFPRVVLLGEPFEQKEDIASFCKKLNKENPKAIIEINTNGTIRPVGMTTITNVVYNVHLKLKISGLDYKQRIDITVINWFIEIGANFIFNTNLEDEVDEANLIIQDTNISKSLVFLTFNFYEKFDEVRKWAKYYGYNFAPNFMELLWTNDGRK